MNRIFAALAFSILAVGCSDSEPDCRQINTTQATARPVDISTPIPAGYRCSAFHREPRLASGHVPLFKELEDGIHFFDSLEQMRDALREPLSGSMGEASEWVNGAFADIKPGDKVAIALVTFQDGETMGATMVGNIGQLQAATTFYGDPAPESPEHQYLLAKYDLTPN